VLFIHGFGLDSRIWDYQFETFAAHYRAIRCDLRGFGRSEPPTAEPYDHADDLKALLTYLGEKQAFVVGSSMGGGLALNFALAYPETTRALVCADGSLWGREWSVEFYTAQAPLRAALQEGDVEAAKAFLLHDPILAPTLKNLDETRLGLMKQMTADYSGWHWTYPDPQTAPEPPAAQRLDEIGAPALIIVGDQDFGDFQEVANILCQGLPRSRRLVITGCGHLPNLEAPDEFNHEVLAFLADNSHYILSR
jgi:pimeloyl-ACP methyl ester carboxylesterase